jgi:hypothetical protein
MAVSTDLADLIRVRRRGTVCAMTGGARRSGWMFVDKQSLAVDTVAKSLHLVYRNQPGFEITRHNLRIGVTAATRRGDITRMNSACRFLWREDAMSAMAVRTYGHSRISAGQQHAMLRTQVLRILVRGKAERLHTVGIVMTGCA